MGIKSRYLIMFLERAMSLVWVKITVVAALVRLILFPPHFPFVLYGCYKVKGQPCRRVASMVTFVREGLAAGQECNM